MLAFRRLRATWLLLATNSAGYTAFAAPPSFPDTGNGLWYRSPGIIWSKDWLPIGNGYLAGNGWVLSFSNTVETYSCNAATAPGGTTFEMTQLNIESLWSGGPFQDPVCSDRLRIPGADDADVHASLTMEETSSPSRVLRWLWTCRAFARQYFGTGPSTVRFQSHLETRYKYSCFTDVEELSTDAGAYG